MIELLFVACLSSEPDKCLERSLLYYDITPIQCVLGAQPELAKWVETHPDAQNRSWRCQVVSFIEREA